MKNSKKGFSLVELIVTISIMAVMALVLVPSFIHLNLEAKDKRDRAKLESACVAFEKSMAEKEVQKELHTLVGDNTFKITCKIDNSGVVEFGKGMITSTNPNLPIEHLELWLNAYQVADTSYEMANKRMKGHDIVFELTPQTNAMVAKCSYEIK